MRNLAVLRSVAAPALVLTGVVVGAPVSGADVLELGPGGDVVRISGPAVVTWASDKLVRQPIVDESTAPGRSAESPVGLNARKAALAPHLEAAGQQSFLSPALLEAVAWAESRFRADALSPKGAVGAMQLMPATAADLQVDARDTAQNVRGGAQYLRQMLVEFNGDLELALAGYNAGPGAVRRFGGVPPYKETQAYVAAVLDYLSRHAGAQAIGYGAKTGIEGK
jgi:soluble lytic murein transglycosylase-like protein